MLRRLAMAAAPVLLLVLLSAVASSAAESSGATGARVRRADKVKTTGVTAAAQQASHDEYDDYYASASDGYDAGGDDAYDKDADGHKTCATLGAACKSNRDCCHDFLCARDPGSYDRRCALPVKAPCSNNTQCASGLCADDQCCWEGLKGNGAACTSRAQCCSNRCSASGTCCRSFVGYKCAKDEDCCDGACGDNGLCQPAGPPGPPTIAVYVADSDNNRIIRTDGEGTPASAITWGGAGTINTGPASFNTPRGLAVTDNGASLLVVDVNNRRIVKYSADGVYQLGFNGNTSGNPQFNVPFYVAADAANSIYVSDIAAANVQKFTAAGVFITKTPAGAGLAGPQGVAATPSGNPFVADSGSTPKVLRLTPDLQDAASFGTTSAGLGGIAVDSADRVYVPAQGQGVVEVFDSAGNLLIALTQVARPVNVALDRFGNLYVLGQGTGSVGRVHRFTPAPGLAFVTAWDVTANGLDSANPVGLAAY